MYSLRTKLALSSLSKRQWLKFSVVDGIALADITVNVLPGGHPQDPYSSSAYLELAQEIKMLHPLTF